MASECRHSPWMSESCSRRFVFVRMMNSSLDNPVIRDVCSTRLLNDLEGDDGTEEERGQVMEDEHRVEIEQLQLAREAVEHEHSLFLEDLRAVVEEPIICVATAAVHEVANELRDHLSQHPVLVL